MSKFKAIDKNILAKQIDPPEEIRALRDQVRQLESRLEEYKKEQGTVKGMMRDVMEHVAVLPVPEIQYSKPRKKKVQSPISLVVHLTDWHMGAVQPADEIEGFNEFSPDILTSRIHNLANDVLNWVELHRYAYDVDHCCLPVTGDLVSGDIHDELRITNAYPLPVQAVEAAQLLSAFVLIMAPYFKRVTVPFVCVDNHGRLTQKPQHKEGGYNSINYVIGALAKQMLSNCRTVDFDIYPREQQVVEVKGRRYLLTHGHSVRGWAGFPYYGIQRKTGLEAIKRMRRDIARFDRIIMGHWHAPLRHPWYWIGGSASGTDAYDHANGRESEPLQSAWFVHPKRGEFDATDWRLHED